MMSYSIIITVISLLCAGISATLVWYCRKLVTFIKSYNQMVSTMLVSLRKFEEHLESVYNRETFYGDTTLQSLLSHARETNKEINIFIDENEDIFNTEEQNEEA